MSCAAVGLAAPEWCVAVPRGSLDLDDSRISSDARIAVWAGEEPVNLLLDGCNLLHSPEDDVAGLVPVGIAVRNDTMVSLTRSRLEGFPEGGLVAQFGAEAVVDASAFRGCAGEGIATVYSLDGSSIVVSESLVESSAALALATDAAGMEVVRSTARTLAGDWVGDTPLGTGAAVSAGGFLALRGVSLSETRQWAFQAIGEGSNADVTASIIADTMPGDTGEHGIGAQVLSGAEMRLEYSALVANQTAGVAVSGSSSAATVESCLIAETEAGGAWVLLDEGSYEKQNFGDGGFAVEGELVIEDSILMLNSRTGIYYKDASGSLSGNLIIGNGSYGLALDSSSSSVLFEEEENWIVGNAQKPTADKREDVTSKPGDVPTPSIPEVLPSPQRPLDADPNQSMITSCCLLHDWLAGAQ